MLKILQTALFELPAILAVKSNPWKTLAVRYETPYVNRVWIQWGEYRINLHKIFPCEKSLYHPHPWPSAVIIFSGEYEMVLGKAHSFPVSLIRPKVGIVSTVVLGAGSRYEMVNRSGWHSVNPLGSPSMSIMVTGKPWSRISKTVPNQSNNRSLTVAERDEILDFFRSELSSVVA